MEAEAVAVAVEDNTREIKHTLKQTLVIMIKKSIFAVCSLALALTVSAQNAYDAERLVGSELNGTARFVGIDRKSVV